MLRTVRPALGRLAAPCVGRAGRPLPLRCAAGRGVQPVRSVHTALWLLQDSSNPDPASPPKQATSVKLKVGFSGLVKEYGLPLGVLYLLISKACVVTVFLLLHYEVLGGDVQAVLRLLGLERCMNVKATMELSVTLFGVPISARTVSNFAVAGAINTALTPIELPLALALLQPFTRHVWKPAAAGLRAWSLLK
eukprot:EG_transcript_22493